MKFSAEIVQFLSSWFYRTDRRDDGLWHLFRGDYYGGWWINAQALVANVAWTSGDLRIFATMPADAKGAIFSWTFKAVAAQARFVVGPGGSNPTDYFEVLCRSQIANQNMAGWGAMLFGLTVAGVPNGTLDFKSLGFNGTMYLNPIGYIA